MVLVEQSLVFKKLKNLHEQGKINLYTKYQIDSVSGDEKLDSVKIKHDDGEIKEFKTDYVLGFFGLIMQLRANIRLGIKY